MRYALVHQLPSDATVDAMCLAYQEMSLLSEARARLVEMSALDYRTTALKLD